MKTCSKCKIEKEFSDFSKSKHCKSGVYTICKSCKKDSWKVHYANNKDKIKATTKAWRETNKGRRNARERERRKTEPLFKMICNLRNRTNAVFRIKGYKKSSKTQEMLGVDWEVCKAHIEKQFTEGMNWDNYNEWHIDHIIPLASAKNEEELMKLFHYRNLQPLWAEDNLKKNNKIQGQQTYFKL